MRTAELLVRRGLVERGLLLMVSKGLAERRVEQSGIVYSAGEIAETFLTSLTSSYVRTLTERAEWVVQEFDSLTERELKTRIGKYFDQWIEQFQVPQQSLAGEQ